MIDLEDALAPLVDRAPEPPAVEAVARRGRRQRRRQTATLVASLGLVAVVVVGAIAAMDQRDGPRVATPAGDVERVRVTLLDGSQLEISGPAALGLTELPLSFNAELDYPQAKLPWGHSFSVTRDAPAEPGAVVGRYPTRDGHELVVHETSRGVDGVVEYGRWTLVVGWNNDPAGWANWAAALNARETTDGFLVIEPVNRAWRLGPTDGPDLRLGDYAFFGPAHTRCSDEPLYVDARCNADRTVMTRALDPALNEMIDDIDVEYTPAAQSIATITTLTGPRIEITAPPEVLDEYMLQTTLTVDGLQTREPISVQASRLPDALRHEVGPKNSPTADGQQLFVTRSDGDVLEATYGDWTVDIFVPGVSDADRARIASLFAADETPDGFVVLRPRAPMHFAPVGWPDVSLNGVSVTSHDYVLDGQTFPSPGAPGTFAVIDNVNRPELVGKVHVREVD